MFTWWIPMKCHLFILYLVYPHDPPASLNFSSAFQHSTTGEIISDKFRQISCEPKKKGSWIKDGESLKKTLFIPTEQTSLSLHTHLPATLRALESLLCWCQSSECGNEGNRLATGQRHPPLHLSPSKMRNLKRICASSLRTSSSRWSIPNRDPEQAEVLWWFWQGQEVLMSLLKDTAHRGIEHLMLRKCSS